MAGRGGVTVKIAGLRELEANLKELSKATARNVLKRTLAKAGKPMADHASRLAPDDPETGAPDLHTSISVSPKIKNDVGKAEFAAVLRGGGSEEEAVGALRGARRAAKGGGSFAEMHIGPDARHFYGSFQERGTVNNPPQPFMRPAWDANKDKALDIIKDELGDAIKKAARRLERKAARLAAKASEA